MYVVSVTVHVIPEKVDDFIQATLENARGARREPGNIRFDVHQAVDDECRFLLYEVYQSPEDFTTHQETDHYLIWRETVKNWMAKKREGVKHYSLFPSDSDW